jgi:hypothetical protein
MIAGVSEEAKRISHLLVSSEGYRFQKNAMAMALQTHLPNTGSIRTAGIVAPLAVKPQDTQSTNIPNSVVDNASSFTEKVSQSAATPAAAALLRRKGED